MPNKTRKPAKPAKPSKPVHRVRLTEQATPTKKARRHADGKNLRPLRRRRICQAAGGQVRSRRQRTAGKGRRGPAPATGRSHDARDWPPSRPSCRPAGCMPPAGAWCPTSRTACTSTSSPRTWSIYRRRPAPIRLLATCRAAGTRSRQGTSSSPRRAWNAAGGRRRSLNETATSSPFATSTTPTARPLCGIALSSR